MKTFVSTGPAFFAAALVITLSFGCGEAAEGETGSSTLGQSVEASKGTCNAILATGLGTVQQCARTGCGPGSDQCRDVIVPAFVEFVSTPGCLDAFADGELNGLPGNASIQPAGPNAEAAKRIGVLVCEAVDGCGLCPAAFDNEICLDTCTPPPMP